MRFLLRMRAELLVAAAVVSLVSGAACTSTKLGITSAGFDEDGTLVTQGVLLR